MDSEVRIDLEREKKGEGRNGEGSTLIIKTGRMPHRGRRGKLDRNRVCGPRLGSGTNNVEAGLGPA